MDFIGVGSGKVENFIKFVEVLLAACGNRWNNRRIEHKLNKCIGIGSSETVEQILKRWRVLRLILAELEQSSPLWVESFTMKKMFNGTGLFFPGQKRQ